MVLDFTPRVFIRAKICACIPLKLKRTSDDNTVGQTKPLLLFSLMKLKLHFVGLMVLSASFLSAMPDALDDSSKGALDAAKRYAAALQTQNFEVLVELAPQAIVQRKGGREKMIDEMKTDEGLQTIKITKFSFPAAPQLIPTKDSSVYVVPYTMEAFHRKRNVRILIHGFYLAFRADDEIRWTVMDGVSLKPQDIQRMFLDVPLNLTLPRVHRELR